MSFKVSKEKEFTRILFRQEQMWRSCLFILFLWLQSLIVYTAGLFYARAEELLLFSFGLSAFVSSFVLLGLLVHKSLKLTQEGFSIEYVLLGVLLFKRAFGWTELSKVAVEQGRLKTHDILFVTQSKSVFLYEALNTEESDDLLKEIQLFHHYKV